MPLQKSEPEASSQLAGPRSQWAVVPGIFILTLEAIVAFNGRRMHLNNYVNMVPNINFWHLFF